MDRRSFLRAAAVLPLATPALALPGSGTEGITRISCEAGDPGEIAFAKACGDGRKVIVLLNGVTCPDVKTADAVEGWVKRCIRTGNGNIAFNRVTGQILHEKVYGRVEIRFEERTSHYRRTELWKSDDGTERREIDTTTVEA